MSEPDMHITASAGRVVPPHSNGNGGYAQDAQRQFLDHYGLSEQPFGVTPDPRFLYLSPKHRQALAALAYGTESNRGFLTLIANPGMGKTSLLFQYLEGLRDKARTVFLFQTDGDSRDLLYYLLAELGVSAAGKDLPEMRAILNQILLEDLTVDRRVVLVIDEAQNLDEKGLEAVRLLSNFERPWVKLLQIVLAGQPQLGERLAQSSMAQFRQRISFAIRIDPLIREEVDAYVDHRLHVAGYKGTSLFDTGARALLAERSGGIPRNINNLCFCAMSLGWATRQKTINREMMREVLEDLAVGSSTEKPNPSKEPKHGVSRPVQPVGLTLTEPPARSGLSKVAVVSAMLIALSWGGFQLNIEKRMEPFWHAILAAARSVVVVRPAAASQGRALVVSPSGPSEGPSADVPSAHGGPDAPQQGAEPPALGSGGSN